MDETVSLAPLPEPPAGPLPIVPQWLVELLLWSTLAAIIAALIAWWLWRRRRREADTPTPLPKPTPSAAAGNLADRILELSRRFITLGKPRQGCHELARELRSHMERQTGLEVEEMTVDEIKLRFSSPPVRSFWEELRAHQFGRREPRDRDLKRISHSAVELFAKGKTAALRGED